MVLKGVNWVLNTKSGQMVLKVVNWGHNNKIMSYGLESSTIGYTI